MKRKWKIIILLMLIGVASFFVFRGQEKIKYKKIPVVVGDIKVTVLSTGYVKPENRLEIKPPVSGRIEKVLVDEGQYVKKGQEIAIISSTERAALIDAAGARGKEEQKKWEEYYKPMPVYAPIDGTIISRDVEPGQSFTSSNAILVMSDRLSVKAQVDETDIAKIYLKQKAEIILDAYPEEPISAVVDQIAYEAKTINNITTYIVDVIPEKTPKSMLSGMTANVTFFIEGKQNVVLLPTEAIKNKDNSFYVLLEDKNNKSVPIETQIEKGVSDGKHVEIISGLSDGDVVLIPINNGRDKKTNNPFSPFKKKN
ncbi:MAG: HlyD family efflux transporter periplasmic adaptor subunit [Pseudomonadota bacterium]